MTVTTTWLNPHNPHSHHRDSEFQMLYFTLKSVIRFTVLQSISWSKYFRVLCLLVTVDQGHLHIHTCIYMEEISCKSNLTLPLLLAVFFKLSITEGLMLSNMNRASSPGYKDLRTKKKKIYIYIYYI